MGHRPANTKTGEADGGEKSLYLTFDDGPSGPQWTPQVLSMLASHDAKATFFVIGQNAQRFPTLIQTAYDSGHTIANYTFDHHSLADIGRDAFFEEVRTTQKTIGDIGTKYLRPPYGAVDAYTRANAAELGYQIVLWDIDTLDWKRPGAAEIANEVLTNAFPGAIVVMHDGGGDRSQTVEALETVIDQLKSKGYSFNSLSLN